MSIHINHVLDYLDQYPVCRYEGDFPSLLEMIYDVYTSYNPVSNDKIREHFRNLRGVLEKLPREDGEALFHTACDLCLKHEKTAFFHGMVVGMCLLTEINMLP